MAMSRLLGCGGRPCGGRGGAASPGRGRAPGQEEPLGADGARRQDDVGSPRSSASLASTGTDASTVSAKAGAAGSAAAASWKLACNAIRAAGRLSGGQKTTRKPLRQGSALSIFSSRSRARAVTPAARPRRGTRRATDAEVAEAVRELQMLLAPGQPLGGLSAFAKAYADDAFCGRLLRKYNGNVQKSADKLRQALAWREQHRELLESRRCTIGSDERVVGADLEQRPVVYLCVKNQMLQASRCLDQKVVCMLQAIDNMPVGVEKTVHVWDLHGQRFRMSDLNPAPLIEMMKSQESYFAERLQELVIIGMPRMAVLLKDAVWPIVPESTKRKIKFMTHEESQQYLQATCNAETSARIIAAMEQNRDDRVPLEERKKGWMRVDKSGALVPLVYQA